MTNQAIHSLTAKENIMREALYREELPIVRQTPDLRQIPIKQRPKVEDGTLAAGFLMLAFVAALVILAV
jgi:hypothetical protein